MSDENSIRLSNFIPLSSIHIELTEDEDLGVKHLFLKGIAHGFKPNLKYIKIRQSATRKAVRKFNADKKAGRIHQVWIDHAYISFLATAPSEKVIGHVDEYKFSEKEGAKFAMDINPDHPSQIHKAILRRDIDGISIGADVKRENLYCSVDGKNMFSDDCEHYMGQKLDNGNVVLMEVDDYDLDELTVTAKQADPEGKIRFSALNNDEYDATVTFSLDTYDKDRKLVKEGITLQKDIKGESLKSTEKYDKVDTNMTGKADVDNDQNEKSGVTQDKFDQLVDVVATIKQSVDTNNSALASYLEAQEKKEADALITQKREIVNRIIALNSDFGEEELLALDIGYLEKLEKAILPASTDEGDESLNQSFGSALAGQEDKNKDKFTLSRDDIKAWARLRMGFETPAAPKHIQARVRARLNGETYAGEDSFVAYLMEKNKE